jgi:hypothetical protein
VFGLSLPDYLDCELFPESPDPNICVGHREVIEERIRSQQIGESFLLKLDVISNFIVLYDSHRQY